jgi:energy-coupling factor transporter ATP-binding protein EcfA2
MVSFFGPFYEVAQVAEKGYIMAKIHILGGSGSGKTTLARHISSVLHVPHYDLDAIGLEKGLVTEEDAFAITAQSAWVSEGVYLIFTEQLLYAADAIVLLEVAWPVAIWRIILRHITRSLHGTNPYPGLNGIKALFLLLDYPRKYSLNKVADPALLECMRQYLEEQKDRVDPPTPESVSRDVEKYLSLAVPPTAEFVRKYLEKYREKVFIVRNRADRERLMEFLTRK